MPIALEEIAQVLVSLGCPADRSAEMAAQLDKRARQLAEVKDRTYEEAVAHLLRLMAGGWAAPSSTSAALPPRRVPVPETPTEHLPL